MTGRRQVGALGFPLPPDPDEVLLPKSLKLAGSVVGDLNTRSRRLPLHRGQGATAKTRCEQNRVGVRLEQYVEAYVDKQARLTPPALTRILLSRIWLRRDHHTRAHNPTGLNSVPEPEEAVTVSTPLRVPATPVMRYRPALSAELNQIRPSLQVALLGGPNQQIR